MSLLIVGSVALDTVSTPHGKMDDALGGSATYFSIAARLFGQPVNIVAVVGEDFPKRHVDMLIGKGINIDGLQITKGKTFRWEGVYDESFGDPETLDTQLNVFEFFSPELPEHYCCSEFVFLGNIDPALQGAVVDQIDSPLLIAADTMNFWIEGKLADLKKLMPRVDLLVINAMEVRLLSGEKSLLAGARKVLSMGPKILVIKRGEFGSLLVTEDDMFVLPAYPIEAVKDPTGAGDSFAGGFMGYLASRGEVNFEELKRALVAGTVVASFNVEGFSLERLSAITREDVEARMAHFRKITEFTVPELGDV
ncbi:MAG TPA: sugar kinase [candidate division Zixibacteria bacterium]|nr:sugar kinase [candidate division Zixibacteria bacterium]